MLRGVNALGKLLTLLRDLRASGRPDQKDAAAELIALTAPEKLSIMGRRVETQPPAI